MSPRIAGYGETPHAAGVRNTVCGSKRRNSEVFLHRLVSRGKMGDKKSGLTRSELFGEQYLVLSHVPRAFLLLHPSLNRNLDCFSDYGSGCFGPAGC